MSSSLPHDRAVLIASGDELLSGQLLDRNTQWLAQRLLDAGIRTIEFAAFPDDLNAMSAGIRRAARSAPLVVITGGLGPTEGDLTRAALADVMGEPLVEDAEAVAAIARMLGERGRSITARQRRQALRPQSASSLQNAIGTAPGLHASIDGPDGRVTDIFCLPGPPGEMRPMFQEHVVPRLRPTHDRVVGTRLLHVVGVAESECVDALGPLMDRGRTPLVGITASGGILTIRIRNDAADLSECRAGLDAVERTVRARFGARVISSLTGGGTADLAAAVVALLRGRGHWVTTVESCTGGMLGQMLTAVSGSSDAYFGGFVTYSNLAKERLGVDPDLIRRFGAVSGEVARAMASAGLPPESAGARCGAACVAITGIAGPDGGTPSKPVGTVHIGLALRGSAGVSVGARHFRFPGDREDVRIRSCVSALAMLHLAAAGPDEQNAPLLWELAPAVPEHG